MLNTETYSFNDLIAENKAAEINSNKRNLAHAFLDLENSINEMKKEIQKMEVLKEEIKTIGEQDSPSYEDTQRLYEAVRKSKFRVTR